MKQRPHTGSTGTGNHSLQVARYFLSREWLDRRLPTPAQPVRALLTIRLDAALRKVAA